MRVKVGGEWVGSLTRTEPWTEELLQRDYADNEGKTFPFVHQTVNFFVKEQTDGAFEQRAKQYRKYATMALMLRGFYWWMPVYLVLAVFGVIEYGVAVVVSIVLGIMFPMAAELGKLITFKKVYDLKFIKLSFSPGWENQEAAYGLLHGIVLCYVVFNIVFYN